MPQDAGSEKNGGKLPQFRSGALVALGANYPSGLSDPAATILSGISAIRMDLGVIRALSPLYRTPAFPPGSGPDFVNAALALETALPAPALLSSLHAIEARFGRVRSERWAARTLDLDLIAFDDLVLPDRQTHADWVELSLEQQMKRTPEQLILPHPRLAERAFVLVPMADVAPDWRHPVSGLTVAEMLAALPAAQRDEVKALKNP